MLTSFNKEQHKYSVGDTPIPGVSEIMKELGLCDLSGVPVELLNYKRELGETVHEALDLLDKGLLDEESIEGSPILPYVNAYKTFLFEYSPLVEWSEIIFHSERGYAGTADRGLTMNGNTWLLDIKTGCKHRNQRLQTAAYNLHFGYERRGCLYLKEDGTFELDEHEDREDYDIWIFLVRAFHWKKPRYSKGRKWNI